MMVDNNYCMTCESVRRVASEDLEKEGYVGCNILSGIRGVICYNKDDLYKIIGNVVAMGWVDLGCRPGSKSSGMITNEQLIIKGVISCPWFELNWRNRR
jgi:hypothetical protein